MGIASECLYTSPALDLPHLPPNRSVATRLAMDSQATHHQPPHPRRVADDPLPAVVLVYRTRLRIALFEGWKRNSQPWVLYVH